MKTGYDITEEESKRIFWVIQTIFGFIIGTSFFSYASIFIPPYGNDILTVSIALISVYLCVVWSWIDFSFTLIIRPYAFKDNRLEKVRFIVDLVIVLVYSYILAYIEFINSEPFNKSLIGFFIAFTVIYFLYFASGILRRMQYGKKASNLKTIAIFTILFLLVSISYLYFINNWSNTVIINRAFLLTTISLTILFRVIRARAVKRTFTIAVDVDGVLANQIDGIIPIIKRDLGVTLYYNDVISWNLPIKDTSIDKIIVNEQKHRSYIINMPLHKGARDVVDRLIAKYYIVIATARPNDADTWTKEWLKKNKIQYDRYYNLKEGGKHNASEDFDILIDDYIGNIGTFLDKSEGKAILFSQPWNNDRGSLADYYKNGRLLIANNWNEVEGNVAELVKTRKV